MKTLLINCPATSGADALVGVLLDLGVKLSSLEWELGKLDLDGEYHLHADSVTVADQKGTRFTVHVHGSAADCQAHGHSHGHSHEHGAEAAASINEAAAEARHEQEHAHGHAHAAHEHNHKHEHGETCCCCDHGHDHDHKHDHEGEESGEQAHSHDHEHEEDHGHKHEHDEHCDHDHDHDHEGHEHSHAEESGKPTPRVRTWAQVREMITESALSAFVKEKSLAALHRIALAEDRVNNTTGVSNEAVDTVTFLSVGGATEALIYTISFSAGIEKLGIPGVIVTNTASESEVPSIASSLLTVFAESFGGEVHLPIEKSGTGLGGLGAHSYVVQGKLCVSE